MRNLLIVLILAFGIPCYAGNISSNGTGGGNWSAGTSWSGGTAPTTNDVVTIVAGDTVTIDDAADATITLGADAGAGGDALIIAGTLQYLSTATANHILECRGDIEINSGGSLIIGTSANPIPLTRKFTIELNKDGADGDYGLKANAGATLTLQGASKTHSWCLLASDAAANATSLTVDRSTGWKDNDVIAIASTTRTYTQCEVGALNGDASGTGLTVDGFGGTGGGVANAHSGTTNYEAEVINLTRSVVVTSDTTTLVGYVYTNTTSVVDCDWVEFSYLGENATGKRGIDINTTTGTATFTNCSVHDTEDYGFYINTGCQADLQYNVLWNTCTTAGSAFSIAGSTSYAWVMSYNVVMLTSASNSCRGFDMSDISGGTFTYNRIIGTRGSALRLVELANASTFAHIYIHSCDFVGIEITTMGGGAIDDMNIWRCNSNALSVNNTASRNRPVISNSRFEGSPTQNLNIGYGAVILFYNCTSGDDATYTTSYGIYIGSSYAKFIDCDFDVPTAPVSYDIYAMTEQGPCWVEFYNCKFGSSFNQGFFPQDNGTSYILSARHNNTDNTYKLYSRYGIYSDHVTGGQAADWAYGGSGVSQLFNPTSSTAGQTLSYDFSIPVNASTNPQIQFYVRKTSSAANCTLNIDVYDVDDYTKLVDNASVTLTDSWAQYSVASISPTRAGYVHVVLKALDGSTTGDIGLDNITYVRSGVTYTEDFSKPPMRSVPTLPFDGSGGGASSGAPDSSWLY